MRDNAHNEADKILKNVNDNVYVEIYGGMGSFWYVRKNKDKYESFWVLNGQMSDNELIKLAKFLSGFTRFYE